MGCLAEGTTYHSVEIIMGMVVQDTITVSGKPALVTFRTCALAPKATMRGSSVWLSTVTSSPMPAV